MRRRERNWLHLSAGLAGATGIVYAVMRYLLEPSEPFAVVNHPWQPHVQHLHVLTAPLLVFGIGLIWIDHVRRYRLARKRRRRRSGLAMAWLAGPMIVSGYALQVSVDDLWRTVWIIVHAGTSGVWLTGYLAHQLSPGGRPGRPR